MTKFILIITFCFIFSSSFSQCDGNNVSTDYTKPPTNNALPTNPNGYQYLNEFNWVPYDQNGLLMKYQTLGIDPNLLTNGELNNIYNDQMDSYYDYLMFGLEPNPQNGWEIISFNTGYFPNNDVLDPTPIHSDFPYIILYNKYRSILRVYGVLGPGYALFDTSIDAVVVKVITPEGPGQSFYFNGLFRLTEGLDRSLDRNTEISKVASITKHPNSQGDWFSADFQLAYDPCVCVYESRMEFEFDFIETASKFSAEINSITIEEDLVDSSLVDSDFLNHFNYNYTGGSFLEYEASNGYLIYETIDRMLEDYIDEMIDYQDSLLAIGIHNKEVKRREYIAKAGKYILKFGTLFLTGGGSAALDLATTLPLIAPEFMDGASKLDIKIIGELDKILSSQMNTMVSEWVGEEINPSELEEPISPTANFTESTMRGKITKTVKDWSGHRIYTPGSYVPARDSNISTSESYPIYNEALGVFALLERPKLDVSITSEITESKKYREHQFIDITNDRRLYSLNQLTMTHQIQFRLQEELKYMFNPSLEIEEFEINASIVMNGDLNGGGSERLMLPSTDFDMDSAVFLIGRKDLNMNIESIDFNTDMDDTLNLFMDSISPNLNFNTTYTPLDALNSTVFSFGYDQSYTHPDNFCEKINHEPFTMNNYGFSKCDFVEVDYPNYYDGTDMFHLTRYKQEIEDQNSNISDHFTLFMFNWLGYIDYISSPLVNLDSIQTEFENNRVRNYIFKEDSIYLKLAIKVRYKGEKSNGLPHYYSYSFTYHLHPDDISIDYNNPIDPNLIFGSQGHINQYPEYLVLDGENFDGSAIEGCQLNGSTYLCKAIQDAKLTGTFTVANGYNVIVEAGNEVRVLPEAITPPEMVWQIAPVWDYSKLMPPADADYVRAFCSDTSRYRANSGSKNLRQADSLATGEEEEDVVNQPSIFDFTLYPNPTNGRTTARIALDENAIGDLYITDLNGRKLSSAFENERIGKGENKYNMPTDKLSSGIYLVHLFINGEHHVKRLVKQ